jgi:UDP-glucose 4-epimerase
MDKFRRCLVLGGSGFIGGHLIFALLGAGYTVRSFDRERSVSLSKKIIDFPNLEFFEGDFNNESHVKAALKDCDVCFHLISTTLPSNSNKNPIFDVDSNVIGTLHVLNNAVVSGLRKIIFASSGGTVYGRPTQIPITELHSTNPTCSYGITKLAIEKYLELYRQLHGLDYSVLRLANPFGEGQRTTSAQGAIAVFSGKILKSEPIEIWGDGSTIRDYIYISDVVDAFMACIENAAEDNFILNIGSGKGFTINEIICAIEKSSGVSAIRRYSPARSFDVQANVLDINQAAKELNWKPRIDLELGISKFVSWLNTNP